MVKCQKCGELFEQLFAKQSFCKPCFRVERTIGKPTKLESLRRAKSDQTKSKKARNQAEKKFKRLQRKLKQQARDPFLSSWEWTTLRYKVLKLFGRKCMNCGATSDDAVICVDHIKSRAKHDHLKLDIKNQQVLCKPCNKGKGAWDETDFRTEEQKQLVKDM